MVHPYAVAGDDLKALGPVHHLGVYAVLHRGDEAHRPLHPLEEFRFGEEEPPVDLHLGPLSRRRSRAFPGRVRVTRTLMPFFYRGRLRPGEGELGHRHGGAPVGRV